MDYGYEDEINELLPVGENSLNDTYSKYEKEEMAIQSIRSYLNKNLTDDYIRENYEIAIKRIVDNITDILLNNRSGVASISKGTETINYDTSKDISPITDDVKFLLPKPYIKLF